MSSYRCQALLEPFAKPCIPRLDYAWIMAQASVQRPGRVSSVLALQYLLGDLSPADGQHHKVQGVS